MKVLCLSVMPLRVVCRQLDHGAYRQRRIVWCYRLIRGRDMRSLEQMRRLQIRFAAPQYAAAVPGACSGRQQSEDAQHRKPWQDAAQAERVAMLAGAQLIHEHYNLMDTFLSILKTGHRLNSRIAIHDPGLAEIS